MKAKSIIFLSIGILLILLNIITDIIGVRESSQDLAYNIGSLIGSHLFGVIGIAFIIIVIKQVKRENKRNEIINDEIIESIGKK